MLIHMFLLACVCLFLPMTVIESWAAPVDSNPIGWLLGQLALCVGLPFFVISSSAPLLQRWFSASNESDSSEEPWFLYAISNVGSLTALISYPLLFERWLGLSEQGVFWTVGFMLLAAMFAWCIWYTLRNAKPEVLTSSKQTVKAKPLSWSERLRYITMAAIPSSLMLGVTTLVSTEIGSFPLMWSIPLALYLLTFVFVFARRQVIPHHFMIRLLPFVLLLMPFMSILNLDLGNYAAFMIGTHFVAFFIVAMVCHGELARQKPDVSQLTEFYLMMSIGGVIGGAFNSLLAPIAFNSIFEYPLMLAAACFVLPTRSALGLAAKTAHDKTSAAFQRGKEAIEKAKANRTSESVWIAPLTVAIMMLVAWVVQSQFSAGSGKLAVLMLVLPAVVCLVNIAKPMKFALAYTVFTIGIPFINTTHEVALRERGFFGVNQVAVYENDTIHTLINGRTCHGIQRMTDVDQPQPLTYFHKDGPVGDLFELHGNEQSRVAVVGLGIGSIAAYGHTGQEMDFYEIDPVVCDIANDTRYFTFLDTSKSEVEIILGDARVQLKANLLKSQSGLNKVAFDSTSGSGANAEKRSDDSKYGLIVLDAFGSDSVPIHLLTVEAIELYMNCLKEDGLLAVHISSKFLDLTPVGVANAEQLGLHGAIRHDNPVPAVVSETGRFNSRYMIFARNEELVEKYLENGSGWESLKSKREVLWTDEHANILDVIVW